MNWIQILSGILGLSFVSGVNLYAAILMVGLGTRFGFLQNVPLELHVLAHPVVLGVAGVLYILEFCADKIPFVDTLWDAAHTLIRPLGGALLALHAAGNTNAATQAGAFLAGGSVALGVHAGKMGLRILAHGSPEPISHSIISLIEDVAVVFLVVLVYRHPLVACCVLILLIAALVILTPLLWRTIRFLLRVAAGRVASWFPTRKTTATCPAWLDRPLSRLLPERNERLYRCYSRSLKKSYLIVSDGLPPHVATRGLFKHRVFPFGTNPRLYSGLIFDVLVGTNDQNRSNKLYVTKDWSCRLPGHAVSQDIAQGLPCLEEKASTTSS